MREQARRRRQERHDMPGLPWNIIASTAEWTGPSLSRILEESMANGLISRRRLISGAAALGTIASFPASFRAAAQGLSRRPVRIIVPFTPATGPDIVARLLAPKLQARWDQAFIVENKPGASGTIG